MPIYTNTDSWKVVNNLRQGEIFMFRDILRKAMKNSKFAYKHDKDFIGSLEPNTNYNEPYIYSYNIADSLLDRGQYIKELENLIKVANFDMSQSKKYYNKYKFDILGTWTEGKIIIMMRYQLTEKEAEELEKKKKKTVKKFYKDTYKKTKEKAKDILI